MQGSAPFPHKLPTSHHSACGISILRLCCGMAKSKSTPELSPGLAKQLAEAGMGHIGVDEAGRGCLAGPVCAGAVYTPQGFDFSIFSGLTDSKKLNSEKRERLEKEIKAAFAAGGLRWGIGLAWAPEIDKVNILNATFRAMSRAVFCLQAVLAGQAQEEAPPLFIDGSHIIPLPQWKAAREKVPFEQPRQFAVIKGDLLLPAISAASILAKVQRDRLMTALDRLYPAYGFAMHKGYGTREHMEALALSGPCKQHRLSFGAQPEEKQLSLL